MATKQIPPMPVRLPDDLKYWVQQRAKSNHRSVNGEIITILAKEKCHDGGSGKTDLRADS